MRNTAEQHIEDSRNSVKLSAQDVLKAEDATLWDIMSISATAARKTKLLQNAVPGKEKSIGIILYSETCDWNTVMVQGLQNWTVPMGTFPKKTLHQKRICFPPVLSGDY